MLGDISAIMFGTAINMDIRRDAGRLIQLAGVDDKGKGKLKLFR
jgi:hypothetical protein